MTQRYTDRRALDRMLDNLCPECGQRADVHTGWGAPGCTLTDNGVADRIRQYFEDLTIAPVPSGRTETHE